MSATPSPRGRAWLRAGLAYLAFTEAVVGAWQLLLPKSFYDDFPLPGHPWVSSLPPYNEHLMRDVGGLNLGLALILAVAAIRLGATLARTAVSGYLLFALPHLLFHLGHLHGLAPIDLAGQVVTLVIGVIVPIALLYGLRHRTAGERAGAGTAA
ncbi:hypothetical protein HNP84_003111 [Thermocatellispora tengchongensis]|uniref:Uncharacterized protein n=1 Tax=Thermocatellispora tengchongensis TaxID=1073253 RepID=A0A840PBK2_9ACTN|nr:hypothetical protein [Thermocatellispora tengchongensis]MBB5133385.1 hypothetical protein [Thermocatellispora tengchongensis]